MKKSLVIAFLLICSSGQAQSDDVKLTAAMKEFHQALINKNTTTIDRQTHKALSYGHSNGWIETKSEMIKNLETGYISYSRFQADSLVITIEDKIANVRFIADINATMFGKATDYHLKVLEVWVKKGKRWLLFARQSVNG